MTLHLTEHLLAKKIDGHTEDLHHNSKGKVTSDFFSIFAIKTG
jgi:hypothetical protein